LEKRKELPIVSAVLVAVNVIIFLICNFTGDMLYDMGRLEISGVLERGEYGRVVFSMFLHTDFTHIFNNMVLCFFLGAMLEKELGHIRYTILYLLSGIGGNILSLIHKAMLMERVGSVGASGAVFGLDGALLALILFADRRIPSVTPTRVVLMIVYSLYSGFVGSNVDNAGHIGGLLTGFAIGVIICTVDRRKKEKVERCNFEH